ncbi:MAG: NADH-quinone oxidoreductase subunit N [Planctomycetes bacterium]|nr:NADH-quinone oxidoreductase subunit N [Planctomycetota bacterium]
MNATFAEALQSRLPADAVAFLPELVLCGAIVVMLLIRLVPRYDRVHMGAIAILIAGFACGLACYQWTQMTNVARTEYLFGGMLVFDNFTIFLKIFLLAFLTLVILLTLLTGIPDREDSADFYVLLFGSTLGMSLMASSSHLLMVFLSIEMASLPSYALAGFLKGRRQSSEAALKYVVYGGGASGVMLYGISLLAGKFGTGFLPVILVKITAEGHLMEPAVVMGLTFILAGIGFKLASVPFHFWCPDVFEGAAAEVGAFLSVASKGAALAMLARVVLGMGGLTGTADRFDAWNVATDYLVPVLAVFAVLTTTFGNLAAYGQTNLKRLLAYSTIAHAGFMMMGLAALNRDGAAAVLFYLVTYLFMNLGAFAVVAMLRNLTGQEDISYFRGFIYRSPILVITLGVFLLSLLGMPPLAGFMAKFHIFTVLYDAGQEYDRLGKPHLSWTMYALLLAGGLNTVISLFYYVKVLKVMILEKTLEDVEERPVEAKPAPILHSAYAVAIALVVLVLGVYVNPLADASGRQGGIADFRSTPRPTVTKGPPKNAPIGLNPGMKMGGGKKKKKKGMGME